MLKKMLAILIATLMVLSLITGCVKTGDNSKDGTKEGGAGDGGPKHHTLTMLGSDRRYDFAPFTERDQYPAWKEMEEYLAKNNITLKFELVPKEQYDTFIKTKMAAGSDLPDIVRLNSLDDATVVAMGDKGLVIDINEAIKKYSNGNTMATWKKYLPAVISGTTTSDGKIYWYSSIMSSFIEGKAGNSAYALLYREDWRKKLNIEAPKTTDELLSMLKAFRENDVNGDGAANEIATIFVHNFFNGIAQAYGLAQNFVDINETTGKAVSPWYQPGLVDYIGFMKNCLAEGVIDASLIGALSDVLDQKNYENKGALVFSYGGAGWLESMTGDENADYVPIIVQGRPDIAPSLLVEDGNVFWDRLAITKNCKDVEGAVHFFDTIYTEEYRNICVYGVEGVTYRFENGKPVLLPEIAEQKAAERAENKTLNGALLWGNTIIPFVDFKDQTEAEYRQQQDLAAISRAKQDFHLSMLSFKGDVYKTEPVPLALPTDKEREVIEQYYTVLETYSNELLVNLILGKTEISQLDDEINKMKKMGLDDVLSNYQARHDRYVAAIPK